MQLYGSLNNLTLEVITKHKERIPSVMEGTVVSMNIPRSSMEDGYYGMVKAFPQMGTLMKAPYSLL